MSKIKIEVDTKENTITCKIDGTEIPNVTDVCADVLRGYDGEFKVYVGVGVEAEDVGTGLKKFSRISTASEKVDASTIVSKSPDGTLIFVDENISKLSKAFSNWFGR